MGSGSELVPVADMLGVGLLTASVPRAVVDEAVEACGRGARRSGGVLPPHLMVYFAMAMALFADEDYPGVMARLAEPLRSWGGWDPGWMAPTSGGITQARARLGFEPVMQVFQAVAQPVATVLTRGAWLRHRRLVSIDGMVFDLPDSAENVREFGRAGGGVFPQARVTTLVESGSHCALGAVIGGVAGKGTGERSAAAGLFALLDEDMLLTADRGFYSFDLWCAGDDAGAGLLWRIGEAVDLPPVADVGDGSFISLVFARGVKAAAKARLLHAAKTGADMAAHRDQCRLVRVVEYYVNDRGPASPAQKELFCLITNLLDPGDALPGELAVAYHDRWEHEGANAQIKTGLRGPGKILRSHSPDMVRQEIWGYLLAHYAIAALICRAATDTDTDPDRIKFKNTVRLARRRITDPAAFSP
ncbi:IS4 family transposase [Catenulispora subtropica]|uniref:IS4-like element ISSod7 family transposase n=1 Tax=Catenulispora subtropica TaxID=450798 RepID=A0ABP5F119_9ACTN